MQISHQRMQETLSQVQGTFHNQLLDAVGQAVIATDLDGTITYWNHAAETLYGWESDEVLGRNIVDVTPVNATHAQAEEIMERLRAGQTWTGEFLVQRSDGSIFPAHVVNTPIYDQAGKVIGIAGVSSDSMVQHHTMRQFAFEKNHLQSIFEHAPTFMCVLYGPDHVFQMTNLACYEVAGDRDFLGKPVLEALPEIAGQGVMERLDEVYRTGIPFSAKEMPVQLQRIPDAEPETLFVNFIYQPLKEVDDTTIGILVHGVDVTEKVKARKCIREASQHNEAIMNRSLDVICICDGESRVVRASAASERILGYTPAELQGRSYHEFVYAEDLEKTTTADHELRQGCDLTHFENRFVGKDGSLIDMMWSSTWSEQDQLFFAVGRDVTKMKERERALDASNAALRKSEQRLKALVDATAQVVWTAEEEGNATELSDAWTMHTGQTMQDLNNGGWSEVLHPDDRDRVRALWQTYLASKTAYENEYRVRHTDGSYRWLHAREVPVFDPDGTFVEWMGACTDIDAKKRAEAALRESEARYRTMVNTANEGVCLIDMKGRTTFVNAQMAKMLGYTVDELQGRVFFDFIAEEDQDFIVAKFEQRWRRGRETYDIRLRQRDGSLRWALVSVGPFYDEAGAFAGSLAMVADITERKRAEEKMQHSVIRYQRLVQHIDGIVWEGTINLNTGDLEFCFVSDRLRDILGFEPQTWLADASLWTKAIHEEDRCWVPEACLDAAEQDHALEYRVTDANGKVVWLHDIVRIIDRQGDWATMAGLMLDITERKQAEKALIQAKQEAEEMARLKSAFLTNMSHEIRTPLAGILGFAEIIAEEATGEVREYAKIIGQSGERLKDTLSSVLDLARLESGSMRLAPEKVDVVQQVQQLLPIFARQTSDQDLYLRLKPEVPYLFARVDRGALARILTNLIGNGLKFTQQGGVTIRLGKEAGHLWVEVADTGIGISETFLSQLYEEFHQESEGLTRIYEGTGLGLSITKRLVDLMDGTIAVESKKEVGTTFTVRLPISYVEERE